ncbi:hypothetical protein BDB00DRAFT_89681 [Zychaea mexicana]|uniref:uncharacterized protein n=1 Tax=Zychaea mexicana TaxID=64656 RepID=UPI0022FE286A|nr:uncharacterized protein BDB00DRAFT_89681 [Zychaea mexicana]KAI9485110.1 hypothetical protein BDB00DRAFT_89681 [Zychaea mexicana]
MENKTDERIFVVGGTGNIGATVLNDLVESGAQVTLYTRSPHKVVQKDSSSSSNTPTIVQGDYSDLTPLEKAIVGHTRLFLLVGDVPELKSVKIAISKKAYAAGVKQVVEISAKALPWRKFRIIDEHLEAEQVIFAIPDRGAYVSLRPTNFMSNVLFHLDALKGQPPLLIDTAAADEPQEWISPYDVAQVAVRILQEPIDKHGDAAYELVGEISTPSQRAAILSTGLGRTITFRQLPVQELYDSLVNANFPHATAYFLASYQDVSPVTRGLPLLLGRKPETFETWVAKNKDRLQ